mgnify:FL=1|jgi:hypothetical protein
MLLADGFEGAFIGVSTRCGQPTLAVYDANKCLQILIDRDDMTHEEALEYFNFNVIGAWVGDETPLFLESMSLIEACNLDGGVNDNE